MSVKSFFTADLHLGHENIIKYCNRPDKSVNEMDRRIINNWNSRVGKNDYVYLLGDVAFVKNRKRLQNYVSQLNGKIILIKGNHDHKVVWKNRDLFYDSHEFFLEKNIEGVDIVLCHYAMRVWNGSHRGVWHLYGHSHGTLPEDPNSFSFDVGVDCNNFYPISMQEVERKMIEKYESLLLRY